MTQTEALNLAKKWQNTSWDTENPMSADNAVEEASTVINALIEALAQPEQEPVAIDAQKIVDGFLEYHKQPKQEPVIKEFTQVVDFVRDIEVEKVKFQLSYGTEELSETPRRIGFFIASQTFGSTMKEYFDDVQSLRELQKLIEVFLSSVNAEEVKPEQEPVGEIVAWPNDVDRIGIEWMNKCPPAGTKIYTTPPQMDELLRLLKEARTTLEMWKDVAPAVSLCADIDSAIAKASGGAA